MAEKYSFYGWEGAKVPPVNEIYKKVESPQKLYDILSELWCADTCAPRMRGDWTKENKTLGQCSITAFLAQDIFGGKVCGIERPGGNFHCYNVVGDCVLILPASSLAENCWTTRTIRNSSGKSILQKRRNTKDTLCLRHPWKDI